MINIFEGDSLYAVQKNANDFLRNRSSKLLNADLTTYQSKGVTKFVITLAFSS